MTDHARIKPRMSAKVARACVCGEVRRKKPLPFDFEKGRKRYDGVPYHERKTEQVDSCKAEGTNLDADHSKTLRLTPSEVKERKRNAVYMRTDAGHNPVGMFLACLLSGGLRIDNTVNTKHNATAA
ncbi:hypothetical protein C0Q70_09656 [Pomacea canaliculata]|uniref:Uncharacterized protein n=1 Tax=Pomacea canaliculata TaxID=400727 RepID=A0A2T7PAE2_POMCA|nr:hypothetical protein C0Q70_09656 [Pomacea canaliculata]